MVVDGVDAFGDVDGEGVPATLGRIARIEVVLRVLAGAATVLDDVLVVVADDDREIAVLLHPFLGDGFDGPLATVAVDREDGVDDGAG